MNKRKRLVTFLGGVSLAILILLALVVLLPRERGNREAEAFSTSSLKVAPVEGAIAPNFSLPTYRGEEISLKQFLGKKVIVTFWSLSCPSCRMELPQLDKLAGEDGDVVVITVVNATPQALKSYFLGHSYFQGRTPNFLVGMDGNYYVFRVYRVRFTPTNYIIDSKGVIRKVIIGAVSHDYLKALLNSIQ